MSRLPVVVRDAVPGDAASLLLLWRDWTRRQTAERALVSEVDEAEQALAEVADSHDRRVVVAELDGEIVAAAYGMIAKSSPLHTELSLHVSNLQVDERARKAGVGRDLLEALVGWAEGQGAAGAFVAAAANSREANRWYMRLGFGQVATLRYSPLASLRAGTVPLGIPSRAVSRSHRNVGHVLAQRRSMRRVMDRAASRPERD